MSGDHVKRDGGNFLSLSAAWDVLNDIGMMKVETCKSHVLTRDFSEKSLFSNFWIFSLLFNRQKLQESFFKSKYIS